VGGESLLFTLTLGRVKDAAYSKLFDFGSTQLLFLTMFINMLIPAFMLLYVFQKKHRWLLVPVFTIILLFCLSSAFRYRILILVFAPILFNYLKKGKRPRLSSCIVLILVMFFIVSIVGAWRNNIRSGTELIPLNWGILLDSYIPNIDIFYPYYRILDIVPEIYPYSFGKGYLYTLTIMIPRALWPLKPYPLAREIMTLAFGENGMLAGPAYPNVGEFYIEFGVAGILTGMYIFGRFARWSRSLYKGRHENLFPLINYALLFPFYLQIVCRGYFPQIFLEALFTFDRLF
jgi:oligosaccharide repeat unit polymerase